MTTAEAARLLLGWDELLLLTHVRPDGDTVGSAAALCQALRERGKTVFFSSHELSEVELVCDHIAILVKGRVAVEGAASALVKTGESLEQYFLQVVASKGGAS